MSSSALQSSLEKLARKLKELKKKISTVESCTGGLLAERLTSIPGSSDYFQGALILYAVAAKSRFLHLSEQEILAQHPVSQATAQQLAKAGLEELSSDICLSVTGLAGPSDPWGDLPGGTVWIGVKTELYQVQRQHVFLGSRQEIREQAAASAFRLALDALESRF